MIEDIFSMVLAIVGIVCVILLTYYAGKWYARKIGGTAGGRYIRIVDRLMVSKTGAIMIVDVEGTQYLIGANDHCIQIMKEFENPIHPHSAEKTAGAKGIGSFRSYLYKRKNHD